MTSDYERLVSFDLETGGLDPEECAILQIGAVHVASRDEFDIDVRAPPEGDVEADALAVNGIDYADHQDTATELREAEREFCEWLIKHMNTDAHYNGLELEDGTITVESPLGTEMEYEPGARDQLVPVGFNVEKFDMKFIKNWMPLAFTLFHEYQVVELNSILRIRDLMRKQSFGSSKRYYKDYKFEGEYTHDALDDARVQCKILQDLIR